MKESRDKCVHFVKCVAVCCSMLQRVAGSVCMYVYVHSGLERCPLCGKSRDLWQHTICGKKLQHTAIERYA